MILKPSMRHGKGAEPVERVINTLVEYDRKGRGIVAQADRERDDALARLEGEKQELAKRCRERSENRVEFVRQQAQAEREDKIACLHRRRDAQLKDLERRFEEHRAQWVEEIVRRCIDGVE